MKNSGNRCVAGLLLASLLAGAFPHQALADVIPTSVIAAAGARDRVGLALSRAEVRERLADYGVERAAVQARVDALADDEVAQLAEHLDSLPAGGDVIVGALVLVFLLLLLTDIVGVTKVFPFTRSIR